MSASARARRRPRRSGETRRTAVAEWECRASVPVGDYRIFRARQDIYRHPQTGRQQAFFVLDGRDWVHVVPLTVRREVVMVWQFRHGSRAPSLEVPGGLIDAGDRSPLVAARRELFEETGYRARRLETLGWVYPNPAILHMRLHMFLARDVRPVARARPDAGEDLVIELVPLDRCERLIRRGVITGALTIVTIGRMLALGKVRARR